MRPISRMTSLAGLVVGVALIAVACSAAATPSPTVPAAAAAPTTAAMDTTAATPAAPAATTAVPGGFTVGTTGDATLGAYLTGANGMTLYVLTLDAADTSSCSGTCATNWPPLTVASGTTIAGPSAATGAFATITRADGTMQVTYNHMPLYYYAGDSAAGDTSGQGKNNTWFVAPLSGSLTQQSVQPSVAGY